MTGNNTGNGSGSSPIPVGQPRPTSAQTNAAYGAYGMHHFHGNVQNLNQLSTAAAKSDDARFGPFAGPIIHLINQHSEVDDKLSSTAKSLRGGLELRTAPPAAAVVYESIPHQTLYDSVTQNTNPGVVGSFSDTWLGIGNKMTDLQNTVAQAIASSEVTWTGKDADAARQSIATLGNQAGRAGQSAQLTGVLIAQQSEALATAKNSVPPPPDPAFDPQAAQQHLQTITDPLAFASQAATDQAQAAAQREAHTMAAHVVANYDRTVAQTSASMPAFAPAPKVVRDPNPAPAPAPSPNPPVSGPVGSPVRPTGPVTPVAPGHQPRSVGVSTGTGTGHSGTGTFTPPTIPHGGPGTTTTTSSFAPPSTTVPPTGSGPGSGDGFGVGPGNGPGVGSAFGGPLGGGFGSFDGGSGLGSGGSAGGSGLGGLGGENGAGGSAAGGSGSGAGSGGARSGSAAGAVADDAELAEGRVGAPGSAGASGMGGMGAGRGQRGKDDAEHKRPSWLVETDEGIFGTDEMTAPPVIGE